MKKNHLEKINSELVEKNFYLSLRKSSGFRGTLYQKAHLVNIYLFSKLWYTAQVIKLGDKKVENMTKVALNLMYSEENERPVRVSWQN